MAPTDEGFVPRWGLYESQVVLYFVFPSAVFSRNRRGSDWRKQRAAQGWLGLAPVVRLFSSRVTSSYPPPWKHCRRRQSPKESRPHPSKRTLYRDCLLISMRPNRFSPSFFCLLYYIFYSSSKLFSLYYDNMSMRGCYHCNDCLLSQTTRYSDILGVAKTVDIRSAISVRSLIPGLQLQISNVILRTLRFFRCIITLITTNHLSK